MHFRHLDLRESVVGSILHSFNTNETQMSIVTAHFSLIAVDGFAMPLIIIIIIVS